MANQSPFGSPPHQFGGPPPTPRQPPPPTAPSARAPKRRRMVGAYAATIIGALVVGLVLGMILGGLIPALRPQPQPLEITLEAEPDGAVIEPVAPDVRGLPEEDARQALADHGILEDKVEIAAVPHLSPAGYVVAQDPIGGTKNPTKVVLSLPEPATVPELTGRDEAAAREALMAMGANATVTRRYATGAQPGQVISTTPAQGEPLTEIVEVIVAATPQTAYLVKVRSSGSCSTAGSSASVNGAPMEHSVSCSASYRGEPRETYWLLNRRTATLTATVGVEDRSDPGTRARLVIDGDGRELFAGEVAYGTSQSINVDTAGVLRLTITTQRLDEGSDSATVLLGDAVLSGSVEDLATLDQR